MITNDINEIGNKIQAFYGSTGIPAYYIDDSLNPHFYATEYPGYEQLKTYLGLEGILQFLAGRFSEPGDISFDAYHVWYIYNCFIYNIVFIGDSKAVNGAIVSGPMMVSYPDSRLLQQIITNRKIPLHRANVFYRLLDEIPTMSQERADWSGRLLLMMKNCRIEGWDSLDKCVYGLEDEGIGQNFEKLKNETKDSRDPVDEEYLALYNFVISIREAIKNGDEDQLNNILLKSLQSFWKEKTMYDSIYSLKTKCTIILSLACLFAIDGNAPYLQIIKLTKSMLRNLKLVNSEAEIINHLFTGLRAMTYVVSSSTCKTYSWPVNRALQYIKKHYREKITLNELAAYVDLNPYYLSRLLKNATNLTIKEHINKYRIEESKNLLINTDKPIQEIAYSVGFIYQSHFNALFKKTYHMTPMKYRKQFSRKA